MLQHEPWSRRLPASLATALLLSYTAPGPVLGQVPETRPELTLEAALASAFAKSPAIAAAAAEVAAARGRWLGARVFPYNPELELDAGEREGLGETSTDRGVALSQEIELAGQRRKRVMAAEAFLGAAEASLLRRQRLVAAQVELAFSEAVQARELLALEEADSALSEELLDITRRRFEAGAATQIDLNLALATAGRSRRRLAMARSAELAASSRLAESAGLDPSALPRATGVLPLPPAEELPPLGELVAGALAHRSDLLAFRRVRDAAEAELRLERARAVPNLRLGAFYEQEEGTDTILGGGFGIALPLFERNQGGIAEATAGVDLASADLKAAGLLATREVVAAWAAYRAALEVSGRMRAEVVGSLEENLELLRRAFEAGRIGASEVLLFRRELVEAQRDWIDILVQGWSARISLDLATGRLSPAPADSPTEDIP